MKARTLLISFSIVNLILGCCELIKSKNNLASSSLLKTQKYHQDIVNRKEQKDLNSFLSIYLHDALVCIFIYFQCYSYLMFAGIKSTNIE